MANQATIRVAAIQAAPVFLDAQASVDKAIELIEEAAGGGARLVAFGEGYLPGHPVWFHVHPVTSPAQIALASALVGAAIRIPGPETKRLSAVARATETMIVMGAVERLDSRSSSLALTAVVIDPSGDVMSRRKLVPAVGERVLFTPGAGDSIRVFPSPWGPIGVLLGGENSNPLLTWTLRELGERIHVAAWPPHFNKPGVMAETASITGRAIAYQNSAHVISVAGATTDAIRGRIARTAEDRTFLDAMAADPGSSVYAPRGALLAGPLPGGDGILFADLDLDAGAWASLVNRQYDRPDLFTVTVAHDPATPTLLFASGDAAASRVAAASSGAAEVDRSQEARRLIADRYGDRLSPDDSERLVPFVVAVLDTSARLEALDPSDPDPSLTAYVDDQRLTR